MKIWTADVPLLPGKVSVVSRPLGDEFVQPEMEYLRQSGIDVLVSMLEPDELPILGLRDEALNAAFVGIRFIEHPTQDQQPPAFSESTLELLIELAREVHAGCHIAAHCRAGQGRSPALAAGVLVACGLTADGAIAAVTKARGRSVPHRSRQRDWVRWVEQQQAGQ